MVGHARLEEGHGEGGGEGGQAGADGRAVVPDAGPDEPARPGQGQVGAEPVQALGDLVAGDLRKRGIIRIYRMHSKLSSCDFKVLHYSFSIARSVHKLWGKVHTDDA